MQKALHTLFTGTFVAFALGLASARPALPEVSSFLEKNCIECHDAETKKGRLDLTALPLNLTNVETFATWVKIHDRVRAGEMPPEKKPRPAPKELDRAMSALAKEITVSDAARQQREGRVPLRRLNRVEFENTLRDLLAVPGLKVLNDLPADGKSHGFDRAADALDFSFVHMDTYLAAVDRALDQSTPAFVQRPRFSNTATAPGTTIVERARSVICPSVSPLSSALASV